MSVRFPTRPGRRSGRRATLGFAAAEFLETRRLLTTYTVNSTADTNTGSGASGTLRYCINQSNATAGGNTINFNLGASSGTPYTITTTSALPTITKSVTINGSSQAGYGSVPVVQILGGGEGKWNGLYATTSSVTVIALTLGKFNTAIEFNGSAGTANSEVVESCYIGLNTAGTAADGNAFGIAIYASSNDTIGGPVSTDTNFIDGSEYDGILLAGTGGSNLVEFNQIGLTASGTGAIGNQLGIEVGQTGDTIGASGKPNVISGDLIGIEVDGTNQSGGSLQEYFGHAGTNTVIDANYIGLNAAGTAAVTNAYYGIELGGSEAVDNTIGQAGAGNVISGNAYYGIVDGGSNNDMFANLIGTDRTGTEEIDNGSGIFLGGGGTGDLIGGSAADANTISGNSYYGIDVNSWTDADISQNSIYSNGAGEIYLENGSNNNQSAPVLGSATASGGSSVSVSGTLQPANTGAYRLEFFASPGLDYSGNPQGETYLGSENLSAYTGAGSEPFTAALPASAIGQVITATATDASGNTSAFSNDVIPALSEPNYYICVNQSNTAQTLIYNTSSPVLTPEYATTTSAITSLDFSNLTSLTINDSYGSNDAYGNPLPNTTVSASGSSATLTVLNNSFNASTATINASQLVCNTTTISYWGFSSIIVNGALGNSTLTQTAQPSANLTYNTSDASNVLNVQGGNYSFPAGANPGTGLSITVGVLGGGSAASVSFASANVGQSAVEQITLLDLTIYSGGTVTLGARPAGAGLYDHTVLSIYSLNNNSTAGFGALNLNDNDAIVLYGSLAQISTLTGYGCSGAAQGIYSSVVNADSTHLTALGTIVAGSAYTVFDGVNVKSTSVLLKYTYIGDANLDGTVDGGDYTRIDNGCLSKLTGWYNGDFNYDGVINGSDYTLIDNAFNRQRSTLNSAGYTVNILASFDGPDTGKYIYAGLTLSPNQSTLYGVTYTYGPNGGGDVFSEPVGGGASPTVLGAFTYGTTNGAFSSTASLILSSNGNTLYGTSQGDGTDGDGAVFSVPVTGGTPQVLGYFNGSNGSTPQGRLVLSSNGSTLYGTTASGGLYGHGTVFSIPAAGGPITTLASFNGSNGADPVAGLILIGNTLYGTTAGDEIHNDGTVFSLNTSGGTPTVLATFNDTNGYRPLGELIHVGNTLYGTTEGDGTSTFGSVFSLPITGGTVKTLATFTGITGNGNDLGAGLLLVGSTLYGSTYGKDYGVGANALGTVFSVPITGGNPTTLVSFSGPPTGGANPVCTLVADSNGVLYGTTDGGGTDDYGTIFSLTPIPVP